MREPRAYNSSILFMVAMPYLLLGGLGLLMYLSIYTAGKNRSKPPPNGG